jgi:threonine/homoserine/homoserine lactone efflux protein
MKAARVKRIATDHDPLQQLFNHSHFWSIKAQYLLQEKHMTITQLFLFASIYFAAVSTPGPGIAAIVARGLAQGTKGAVPFIAGFVLGDLIWLTVAVTGLSVIAQTFEALFLAIKYLGCAYLLFIAWKIWNASVVVSEVAAKAGITSAWTSFLGALTLTLGNPKVIVFFMSVMPLVVDMNAITPLMFTQLVGMAFFVLAPVMTGYLLLANRARRLFKSETALRRINRGTAAIMAGTAVAIAAKS